MPKTLLLADDSITIQKVVGIIFASEDYSVTTANNGEDALSRIRDQRPDIVLADVVMPRKNGYELCEAVKNDPELRDIPVLLLAGTFEAFDEARAKAVRADGWLQKPFESSALLGRVREIVEGIEPSAAPALPYVTAGQRPAAAPVPGAAPAVVPPPRGAPLPAGARPLPGPTSPFAAPPQPFAPRPPAPPPPPPPPFAARPSQPVRADLSPGSGEPRFQPPFTVRTPTPPAPPPPPPAPSFRAPPTPARAEPATSGDAQRPPVVVPLPPPPPPPAAAPIATLDELDFSGATFDEPLAAAPQPLPAPASPPHAPAIPTQKVSPPVEPHAELDDFDIDEAAAPIDLADLAAEEISEEEALSTSELHAEVAPLRSLDLPRDEPRPPPLDLSREEPEPLPLDLSSPWDDELPARRSAPAAPSAPADSFADLFGDEGRTPPALEITAPLDLEAERAEPAAEDDAGDSRFRLDADPLPFRPYVEPPFEDETTGPRPFELGVAQDHEPAFTAMPAFPPAAPFLEPVSAPEAPVPEVPAPLAPPPPIAVAADEAVLREALSRASRETIEKVVWEVVPQLAEAIIREQLDRLMKDRKNP